MCRRSFCRCVCTTDLRQRVQGDVLPVTVRCNSVERIVSACVEPQPSKPVAEWRHDVEAHATAGARNPPSPRARHSGRHTAGDAERSHKHPRGLYVRSNTLTFEATMIGYAAATCL